MVNSWMVIGGVTLLVALGGGVIRPRDIAWEKRLDRPKWLFFNRPFP